MNEENEVKGLKLLPEEKSITGRYDLDKYSKIIKEISQESPVFNNLITADSERLTALLLHKLGLRKAKKVIKNLKPELFEYLVDLYNLDYGSTMVMGLSELKELDYTRIIDFVITVYKLKITDKEGIRVISKAAARLRGMDNLLNTLNIQDNYVREVIYNRPHFTLDSKIRCILNASKHNEGTYIIKYGNLFLNTEKNGDITKEANDSGGESRALGLFLDDMRFINQYELRMSTQSGNELPHELISAENHNFGSFDENVFGNFVTVKRKRLINGALFEKMEFINSGCEPVKVQIAISSLIKDIFEVRGKVITENKPAKIETDCYGNILVNTELETAIYGVKICIVEDKKEICPVLANENTAELLYKIDLNPDCAKNISLSIQPLLNYQAYIDGETTLDPPSSYEEAQALIENSRKTEFAQIKIDTNIPNAQKTIDQSIKDLNMLVNYVGINDRSYSYISAGLPRYGTLFGRDSIITALQVFKLNDNIARDTLELLGLFQGKSFEERYSKELCDINNSSWSMALKNAALKGIKEYYIQREEASGKILHELRIGDLAKKGTIPHAPYYGTVDATPLWLVLYAEYYKWSRDRDFLIKLLPNAEAAIEWINSNIINGYLRFTGSTCSKVRIQNQGWKDAGDSIRHVINEKGFLADPEYAIALAEVQGYVYQAFQLMGEIYNELGEKIKAKALIDQAKKLKLRFNKDFWMEDEQFFSMALDKNNIPVANITSNIGHCMATGIIEYCKTALVENKLLSEDLYTGWGIRTLSCKSPAYDPLSYHNGSVWIHDTAFAATGLSKNSMEKITRGLFEAANMFENNRLPELFGGFQRKENDIFIQNYPEACSPQAWASGSLIWLLLKLIGLNAKDENIIENLYIQDYTR